MNIKSGMKLLGEGRRGIILGKLDERISLPIPPPPVPLSIPFPTSHRNCDSDECNWLLQRVRRLSSISTLHKGELRKESRHLSNVISVESLLSVGY